MIAVPPRTAVDLFAGAGGWDVAARAFGLELFGVENEPNCVATRKAAGLRTFPVDVRHIDPMPAEGLVGSPPCGTFSMSGKGSGRRNLRQVLDIAGRLAEGCNWRKLTWGLADERTALVLEPLHWIVAMQRAGKPYRWIALEQVPPVLPVWEHYARILRDLDYSAITGNVQAEQYGVPQTRRRAVLLASLDRDVVVPAPTHSRYYPRDPERLDGGVLPWVSMATALGWSGSATMRSNYGTDGDPRNRGERNGDQPAPTVTSKIDRNRLVFVNSTSKNACIRREDQPAPMITAAHDRAERVWIEERVNNLQSRNDGIRVSVIEAAALQSFPVDYPWQGTQTRRFQQIGNAIPPKLADAILKAVTGQEGDSP